MANVSDSIYEIRYLDELSQKNSFIHKLHPLVKLIVSIFYIIITVSFGKYEILSLTPLTIYPIILFTLGDIKFFPILKRSFLVLPVVLGLGIFNPILDREPLLTFMNFAITGGWISYLSLIMKCFLTVLCALLLISTTGINNIAIALRSLLIPKIFVTQFLLTYRYISVLLEEIISIWTAYSLRAPEQKGISYKSWGPLLGQLLIRTYDRAQRIYNGMVLRGFSGEFYQDKIRFSLIDFCYLVIMIVFLLLTKLYNIPLILGNILTGV
ncbi:cobalt ECF transporter T component CbiQ [Alkalibaculum sp. M08DMB]|uniref:Cobalt ECF transporter T component CbiQ n=1 Tax=Alkalibaculum sporogenes TaxID=2655001 RepID=A0A6A7KBW9_9FIRM|nr:cobalt ECF transporter T component CbiQ [Alkalibaculum sporogenes]MPW26781.1 cobalt ECF transporter T component CbiQ [Alkalibaculum sporogenes]